MSAHRKPRVSIPPGYKEIRIRRPGHLQGDWLGIQRPEERHAMIRLRSDGELHPLDKAELLPEGAWVLLESIFATARELQCPVRDVILWLHRQMGGQGDLPLLDLLQHAIHHGHSRPDHSEHSDAPGHAPNGHPA